VRIDDLRDGAGCLFAFEVSSWLGRYGTLQVARTIPGVRIVREPRAWFSWWGDDTFLEFEVEGVTFVAWRRTVMAANTGLAPSPFARSRRLRSSAGHSYVRRAGCSGAGRSSCYSGSSLALRALVPRSGIVFISRNAGGMEGAPGDLNRKDREPYPPIDSSTASAWPATFTLGNTVAILPCRSITKVVRSIPIYLRPYMLFSFHTP